MTGWVCALLFATALALPSSALAEERRAASDAPKPATKASGLITFSCSEPRGITLAKSGSTEVTSNPDGFAGV